MKGSRAWLGAALLTVAVLVAIPTVAAAHGDTRALDYRVFHRDVNGRRVEVTSHTDPAAAFMSPALAPAPSRVASPVATNLASTWCGDSGGRLSDDATHESGNRSDPKIRVIYAYPSDMPNRFTTLADMIQGDVKGMVEKVAGESGATKSLRFDLGTSCGSQYVDITTVPLPHTAAYYAQGGDEQLARIKGDVASALGPSPVKRNYLVFPDQIGTAGGGWAEVPQDEQHGPGNAANDGGWWAMTWYASYWTSTTPSIVAQRQDIHLHDVTHNLGAVQSGAPNSTGQAHCTDEWDVMCYDDDGPGPVTTHVACDGSAAVQYYDCDQNDYFNPSPAAGSYLANNWNTYDSVFLCSVSSCVPPVTAASSPPGDADGQSKTAQAARSSSPVITGSIVLFARVGRSGSVVLGEVVDCTGSGPACRVRTGLFVSRRRPAKSSLVRVARSSFTVPSGRRARVRLRLSKNGLRLLRRNRKLRTRLRVVVVRGDRTVRRQARVTLRVRR
jgi:hypothetical protein